jgi:hypothetical protein
LLVEVKGPNDTLSAQQCAWLQALRRCGLSVHVCHVVDPKRSVPPGRRFIEDEKE